MSQPSHSKHALQLVYENGLFRPLNNIGSRYQEGQVIVVEILTAREESRVLLGDWLEPIDETEDDDITLSTETLLKQLHDATAGVTLSDIIREEREQGW